MDRFDIPGRNIEVEVVLHFTKRVDMALTQTFFRREGNIYNILGQLNELRVEVGECREWESDVGDLGGEEDEDDKDRAKNEMVKVETGVLCCFRVGAETNSP